MYPHVETIFCDDIRDEVNGKVSYIGTYNANLFAKEFPITLPKFCIAVKIILPLDYPFDKIELNIYKDEDVIIQANIDESQLETYFQQVKEIKEKDKKNRLFAFQIRIIASPFQLENKCTLRVRAKIDKNEFRGAGLSIEKVKEANDST